MNWKRARFVMTIMVTAIILYLIYSKIDFQRFSRIFVEMEIGWFGLALLLFAVSALLSSYRFVLLLSDAAPINVFKALRLYLAGNSLNMVLPSKMGDMSKAFFLKEEEGTGFSVGLSSVIAEKVLDVSGLSVVMLLGIQFIPDNESLTSGVRAAVAAFGLVFLSLPFVLYFFDFEKVKLIVLLQRFHFFKKAVSALHNYREGIKADRPKLVLIVLLSIILWFVQVGQIFFFFRAFSEEAEPLLSFALVPIAIFIGLIPIAFAGIGTRDKALIVLFGWYGYPHDLMAAVALMCTLRYIVPALAGLPFMAKYIAEGRRIPEALAE
jgi:hypothetical protein